MADGNVVPCPSSTPWPVRRSNGEMLLKKILNINDPERFTAGYNSKALWLAPRAGASSLLITFGGNDDQHPGMPEGVTNANIHLLAIRDPSRRFGLCGLPLLGNDLNECIANIVQIKNELCADNIFCLGASAGGYPALRYGLELNASGVIGFGAPTTLDLADDSNAPLSRYPQLTALYRSRPDLAIDMARLYSVTSPRPRVILVYSPGHSRDAWLAKRMAHIDGVAIDEVPDEVGHGVFAWLHAKNLLQTYVERLLALKATETS